MALSLCVHMTFVEVPSQARRRCQSSAAGVTQCIGAGSKMCGCWQRKQVG